MSAIFRREQSSPYLAQGSSLSYALRQPPLGFGLGAGALGTAGLPSGLTTGFGSSASNAALLQAASAYQPLVIQSASSSASPSANSASYWPSAQAAQVRHTYDNATACQQSDLIYLTALEHLVLRPFQQLSGQRQPRSVGLVAVRLPTVGQLVLAVIQHVQRRYGVVAEKLAYMS